MHTPDQANYWETQVLTATPQRLRLMLIEGAQRFANQAIEAERNHDTEVRGLMISKARDIVGELLVAIRQADHPIAVNTRGIYAFLFRELAQTQLDFSVDRLLGVIKVLEEERITWTRVCELQPTAIHAISSPAPTSLNLLSEAETVASASEAGGMSWEA